MPAKSTTTKPLAPRQVRKAAERAEAAKKEAALAARRARRERKRAAAEEEAAVEMASAAKEAPPVEPTALGVSAKAAAAAKGGAMVPKKLTEAREHLSSAFDKMGGVTALVAWGRKNPTEFYRIWARLIPKEIPADPAQTLPLETLLSKLSERAEMSVEEAAREIGAETLSAAGDAVNLEDAVAAFNKGSLH